MYADFLEPDALKAGAFSIQELLGYAHADVADHLNRLIADGSFCFGDC